MERNIEALKDNRFDLLVVGGGIHGLCAARDAAMRGLSVALVEKGDFGAATSANSLKLIHGGLRYLQHGDIPRIRQSIGERTIFMKIAPHLVHPYPSLVPTYGHLMKGREVMWAAFQVYNMIAFDRNRLEDPQKRIPPARVISTAETLKLFPGLRREGLTGGAIFYDAQIYNSERLNLSFALASAGAGAALANYAEVTGFLKKGDRLEGVRVKDRLNGQEFEIKAGTILNATGPWTDALLGPHFKRKAEQIMKLAKAVNIVTSRPINEEYALGAESQKEESDALVSRGGRLYFIAPWRGYCLVGTTYEAYGGHPDELRVTEEDVRELVDGINSAYPGAGLRREEVTFHHLGLVPITGEVAPGQVKLAKSHRLIDHQKEDGIEGLVSLIGVKYTTARDVAGEAVNMVFRKLGRKPPRTTSGVTRLPGGEIESFRDFLEEVTAEEDRAFSLPVKRHLAYSYGSDYRKVISLADEDETLRQTAPGSKEVILAEILYGVREEMARKLADVILRRTDLGSAAYPGGECLEACARIMASELGWDDKRMAAEIAEAESLYHIA